ncbi:MAG: LacI family DNA-binding transcriptional regulator [Lachnospiraceae bacterium]|nr:LacI family DNA-binding transcriptional regulator [Lachnospiraceae bacterium]
MGKVRMADIAEHLGVSTVSVHNALSGQKGVSDELRDKIVKAADELGYRQRPAPAVNGKNGRSLKNVGVLISEKFLASYTTTYYWKMYQEIVLAASDKNCIVAVEVLKHFGEDNRILPNLVTENAIEGLIVLGELDKDYLRFLKGKTEMPIIFLDFYDEELANDAVIGDGFYGMYLMTEYLYARGFRKMAYVGSIYEVSNIMDRYCGFYKSLTKHHLTLPPEWLIEDRIAHGDMSISLPDKLPEAFVCNCDLAAGMLIQELERRGLRVPEDISVVGFDNYLYPGFPDMRITSYEVDTMAMSKVALEKVLKRLKKPPQGHSLDVISGRIVEKDSVKAIEPADK